MPRGQYDRNKVKPQCDEIEEEAEEQGPEITDTPHWHKPNFPPATPTDVQED